MVISGKLLTKRCSVIMGLGLLFFCGCPSRPQSPLELANETRSEYQELCRTAIEDNDLAVIAWYRDAQDGEKIMDVFFEAKVPAIADGSVFYSVEVRNQDIEKARAILRNDKRLKVLSIKIEP